MIVAGVDGSIPSRAAVDWAAADALRMHEPLLLVHALDRSPYQISKFPDAGHSDSVLRAGQRALNEAVALVHERQPSVEVTTQVVEGTPAPVLCDQGRTAAELVIGSRGHGALTGVLLGSVSTHVAGQAACPVVVVRGDRRPRHGQVVVGVDDSPASRPALAYAFAQASLRGSGLLAVHDRQRGVIELLETCKKEYPQVTVIEQLGGAHPAETLAEMSERADLLVVGSHGRGAVGSALAGSVSRDVLHRARCAVAVVRGT
ncbi:universal stress protein [Nonomuraea gerenzanensis]|uniref:Universal stress protein family n=1 Tax=Nonomuraea gerenzanensis TaxID=93944 RepID=A0A1M4EAY7_9ACTN|nr:universal stress protein [Nonomuraea gerenzanensis]UBU18250.1 universal stress protein [Nonomuraea gerenzanensis]SBO96065.1 Universal stress protein family [Nonomuraea gerenzanensis]